MPSLQPVFGLLRCKQGLKYIQIHKPDHQLLISINTLVTKRHSSIGTVATLTKEPNRSKLPRQSKLPRFTVSKIAHQMWWGRTTPVQPDQRRNKTRKRAVGWRLEAMGATIALSYPLYCYWWLIMKKRSWMLYRSPNPNPGGGVRKCNSAQWGGGYRVDRILKRGVGNLGGSYLHKIGD